MIDKNIFFGILFGLATFYVAIGIWTSQKIRTLQSYFLADRNLGVFQLTFTLVATQLGSGMLLGTSQKAYNVGLAGIFYTVGMGLGFMILGCGLASRMRSLNITTTAEIFETHYKSSKLKLFASALSILSLWGILVAQIIASKMVFLSLGFDDPYVLTVFWSFLVCYTMIGGFSSVVIIDTIQVLLILSVFIFLFFKALPFSFKKLLNVKLMNKMQSYYFYSKKNRMFDYLPTLLMPTLFSLIEQDLAQRFFAAKTRFTASISAFLASFIIIGFSCVPLFFGIFAKIKKVTIPAGADPLIPVIATIASKTLLALAVCGVIGAITSTADSLLSAISSNIVQDFKDFLPLERQKLFVSRLIVFITGCLAVVASFCITGDIISVLENSYRISVICLLVPTLIAYFTQKIHSLSAYISIICGIITFAYATMFISSPILKDLIPLAASLIGYVITHFTMLHRSKCFEK